MNLKDRFIKDCFSESGSPTKGIDVLVTLVKLPTGAIEVITNTNKIESKLEYLNNVYDDEFKLKTNNDVQIVGYTFY